MGRFVWTPPPEPVREANVSRPMRAHGLDDVDALVRRSIADPAWYWDAVVRGLGITFDAPWHAVMDTSPGIPWTEWFVGGRLNLAANCLRHAVGDRADAPAVVAEAADGTVTRHSFGELAALVNRCAAALRAAGVTKGDRVAAYMPMTAEVVIQLLATIQTGAIFIPIFSGYAPPAVAERLRSAEAAVLFTADVTTRRGKVLRIKENADRAVAAAPSVRRTVVVRRGGTGVPWNPGRDVAWDEFLQQEGDTGVTIVDAMDPALSSIRRTAWAGSTGPRRCCAPTTCRRRGTRRSCGG